MKINSKPALCLIVLFVFLIAALGTAFGEDELKRPVAKLNKRPNGIEILVVIDNNPYKKGIGTNWGFSCLVRGTEKTILFDTGPYLLLTNMKKMNITPEEVDVVVLSHSHRDHTGELPRFLKKKHDVTIYLPKSFSDYFKDDARASGARVVEVGGSLKICERVYSTGELGRFMKEQSLVVHTDMGGIVITGCAHPGIVKILRKSKELIKDDLLLAMGGFHLHESSSTEIETIIASMKNLGVRYVGPTHCSGDEARQLFKKVYREHYLNVGVGKVIMTKDLR